MSSWCMAASTQLSNTAACLHLATPLFFPSLGMLSLLSPITKLPVEDTDWDHSYQLGGVLDAHLLRLLLPASLSGSDVEEVMLTLLILVGTAAGHCCIARWVEVTSWGGCAAGIALLEVGVKVGWAGPVTSVIGLLNIIVAEAPAGPGARGLIGATGYARNNGLCCGAVLELPVAAACNCLKISVLGTTDCPTSFTYPNRPDGSLGTTSGSWAVGTQLEGFSGVNGCCFRMTGCVAWVALLMAAETSTNLGNPSAKFCVSLSG